MIEREVKSTLFDNVRKCVTFALDSVKLSHRTQKKCEGKGKEVEEKTPRDLGPADSTVHTREDGPTVQLRGDSACKWINGQRSLGQEYRGRICQIQKPLHWKRKIANPISKTDDFVKHVFREHNQEAGHWADVGSEGQRKIVIDARGNSESWKAVFPLKVGTAMAAEVAAVCVCSRSPRFSVQNINQCINRILNTQWCGNLCFCILILQG